MRSWRKTIFWIHLICGVVVGLVIGFFSVTGALLAFEHPILRYCDRSDSIAQPGPMRLPLTTLVNIAQQEIHTPTGITLQRDPHAPVELEVVRDHTYAVNPYTGEVLGEASPEARHFFYVVTGLHRWLGMADANHKRARAIKNTVTMIFAFQILSGVYLWLPRKWSRGRLKHGLLLRFGIGGRARNWNWHNVFGIWLALPLAVLVGTGLLMSFPNLDGLLVHASRRQVAPPQNTAPVASKSQAERHRHSDVKTDTPMLALDQAFSIVKRQDPEWKSIWLQLPPAGSDKLSFVIDRGFNGEPVERDRATLNSHTGQLVRWEPFSSLDAPTRFRDWARFIHTGEAGGLAGEVAVCLVSLAVIVLVWTGYVMALLRLRLRIAVAEISAGAR